LSTTQNHKSLELVIQLVPTQTTPAACLIFLA